MEFEAKLIEFLQAGASQGWTTFFKIVSLLGSWAGLLIVFLIFFMYNKRYSLGFLVTYGVGVGVNYLLKLIISRPRPYMAYEGVQMLTNALGNSFPSGHAVSSGIIALFVIAFVFMQSKNKFVRYGTILSMLMYVGIMCVARMYLGVHYLTDVLAGVCVGTLIYCIYYIIRKKIIAASQRVEE